MFTLVTDKSRYYRVKHGQSAGEVEKALSTPAGGAVFSGAIIPVRKNLKIYSAKVGDTYGSVAEKFNTDEEQLKRLNGGKLIYPTCKLFVP